MIFDFDGLILETEGPIYQSWSELYASFGLALPLERWLTIVGTADLTFDPFATLEAHIGRSLVGDPAMQRRWQRERELVLQQPVLPGVRQYLEDARRLGLRVAVASSSPCSWITGHLQRLGLIELFDELVAADDVERTKPDPALFLTALARLGVEASQAIVFEDLLNGIRAAKAAGIYVVAVPNELTRRLPLDGANLRLSSLEDISLEELLRRVATG